MKLTLLKILIISVTLSKNLYAQQVSLTFNVDMTENSFAAVDTLLNVGIRGSMEPLSWFNDVKMTDPDNDGIYTASIEFNKEAGTEIYFKYVMNEVEWEAGEALYISLDSDLEFYNSIFRYTEKLENPFKKFIGEWTLKNNEWNQKNDEQIETIKIFNHHTTVEELNTNNSILQTVEASTARGHILWTYDRQKKEVLHLSSFYPSRSGLGKGTVKENGDIDLKVSFEGEPSGTYRLYSYKWISDNEYELSSYQYDSNDNPTGSYYGGNFIRVDRERDFNKNYEQEIKSILNVLDDNEASMETKMGIWVEDLIHMAPDNEVINSKDNLSKYLEEQNKFGYADMEHQIVKIFPYEDIVLMRGVVTGKFYPKNGDSPVDFRTKNLFVFRPTEEGLKIWKVIYNMSPPL